MRFYKLSERGHSARSNWQEKMGNSMLLSFQLTAMPTVTKSCKISFLKSPKY